MEWVKRAFLRACKNKSCLGHEEIDKILTSLCERYGTEKPNNKEALQKFVQEIDAKIKNIGQNLSFVTHPVLGQEFLVYSLSDVGAAQKNHPLWKPEECQYFHALLEKMAQEVEFKIHWNETFSNLDFKGTPNPLKKERMGVLLKEWTMRGYFAEKGDDYYLGPLTMVEFDFYLRTNYAETIVECSLCKNLVFWDIKCSSCKRKIHKDCIRKYLRKRSNCPSCNEKWSTRLSTDHQQ